RHGRRTSDQSLVLSLCHNEAAGYACILASLESRWLLVQDKTQEGSVDVETSVVLNEAQFPEFIHEEIDSGARCPDHFRQSLLRYFGDYFLRLVLLAISREHQQSARQPFLAGVEELIDQVLFDPNVSSKQISDEE